MTTTLNNSCSENTMVQLSEGEGFCMHVFSSIFTYFDGPAIARHLPCAFVLSAFYIDYQKF